MKQNAKRWLALFLAIAMIGSCGVFSNGSLHAEGESPYATTEEMTAEAPVEEAAPAEEAAAVEEAAPAETAAPAEEAAAVEEVPAETAVEEAPAETATEVPAEAASEEAAPAEEKATEETAAVSAASEAAASSSVSEAAEEVAASSSEETELTDKEKAEEAYTYNNGVYTFEDSNVKVTATLEKADAVPDQAEFKVTQITSGQAFVAYIAALNQAAGEEKYTADNTLLYDVAFLVQKYDEEGNAVAGEKVEYEPAAGSVSVKFDFKKDQMAAADGDETEGVEVQHLKLSDAARNSADTTVETTNISQNDVKVEDVKDANANASEVNFKTDSFSAFAFHMAKAPAVNPDGLTVTLTFKDADGNETTAPDLSNLYAYIENTSDSSRYVAPMTKTDDGNSYQTVFTKTYPSNTNEWYAQESEATGTIGTDEFKVSLVNDGSTHGSYSKPGETVANGSTIGDYIVSLPAGNATAANGYSAVANLMGGPGSDTFLSVLGEDAVNYGMISENLTINGDAESNAAAINAKCGSQTGNDVSNNVEQTFILAHVVDEFQIKGFGAYVKVSPEDADKVHSKGAEYLIKDTSESAAQLEAEVRAMLNSVTAQSTSLAGKTVNAAINYNKSSQKYDLDLTGREDGTYYVNVDQDMWNRIMSGDNLRISKKDTQTVVFNVTASGDLSMTKFSINGKGSDSFLVTTDPAPQSIIWNIPNASSLTFNGSATGVFLAPNASATTNSTCSGWIVAKSITINSGEWHNVYQHEKKIRKDTSVTFKAGKTIDGSAATVDGFRFVLEKKNGNSWNQIGEEVTNSGADITFPEIAYDGSDFTEAENSAGVKDYFYRIREISDNDGHAKIGDTEYAADATVYYVKVTVTKTETKDKKSETTKYTASAPVYYTGTMDEEPDYATADPVVGTATFANSSFKNITVTKQWVDNNNADKNRPTSITVELLKNEKASGSSAVLNDNNSWTYTWTNLPAKEDGKDIAYSVKETSVPSGYKSTVTGSETDGYSIKNVEETTSVSGNKTWDDSNNKDGFRPDHIVVNLLADGEKIDSKTVTEADGWSYSFINLPKNKAGKAISYTITENAIAEYSTTVSGTDLINTHEKGKTSLSVAKVWNDSNNQDGKRPESIKVQLLADGKASGDPVVLNDANKWSYTWS
ncbi:MAG: Cna B-type domain-containing protein, partial [Eubacterium sp.]|nr:Cna B-type domain-containing protein [Eubacterium sp.]